MKIGSSTMRWLALAGVLAAGTLVVWFGPAPEAETVERLVRDFGPASVVFLVALGIVVSPIPSGVIAMVAGTLYGTWYGGALTIAGAVLGAGAAFLLSRYLGRNALAASRLPMAGALTKERSQTALMTAVFVTRLVPFISFDAVSYVAGLTPLAFWRFVAATAAGTTPVCLMFAAAGDTASRAGMHPAVLAVLGGVTLVVPAALFSVRFLRRRPAAV